MSSDSYAHQIFGVVRNTGNVNALVNNSIGRIAAGATKQIRTHTDIVCQFCFANKRCVHESDRTRVRMP